MQVKKAYKFRIYPNREQKHALAVQFGHARYVYNWALARRKAHYKATGESLDEYDINNEITVLKQQPDTEWLKEADSQVLQQKSVDLHRAYVNFFAGRAGYPRFKSRKARQSIRYPQRVRIEEDKKHIFLPKVGLVKIVIHRAIEGEMKNYTVSKTKSGKYFVSIGCEVEIEDPHYTGDEVGIDLGLLDFATFSDDREPVQPPKYLRKAEKRLKRLQRRVSRRKAGSRGREKARVQLARQHEKVANQRRDFQHKLSRALVNAYRLVGFENLNIAGMLKNRRLAKSISDAGWAEFVRQVEYKGDWYGCRVEKVGRFFPSSKLCSVCGDKHQSLKLSERKWVCAGCGTIHERDKNAAQNILNEVYKIPQELAEINAGGENVRPKVALPTSADSLKPETHRLCAVGSLGGNPQEAQLL